MSKKARPTRRKKIAAPAAAPRATIAEFFAARLGLEAEHGGLPHDRQTRVRRLPQGAARGLFRRAGDTRQARSEQVQGVHACHVNTRTQARDWSSAQGYMAGNGP